MTLELTHSDLSLLIDSLTTRLSRIDEIESMIIDKYKREERQDLMDLYTEQKGAIVALRERLTVEKYK